MIQLSSSECDPYNESIWELVIMAKCLGAPGGTQLVEYPTLHFSLGHDIRVIGRSPMLGSVLNMEST